jgi:hypothetical protein
MLHLHKSENHFHTLEDIQKRKEELAAGIQKESDQISTLWHTLFIPPKNATKGEIVANVVSKSVTAIDAFLLVRKLMKTYGHIFRKRR